MSIKLKKAVERLHRLLTKRSHYLVLTRRASH